MRDFSQGEKQALLTNLIRLQEEGPINICGGICHNIGIGWEDPLREVECGEFGAYVSDWPEWSGDFNYPIPAHIIGQSPESCYWNPGSLGLWKGTQGEWRKSLIAFTINKLRKDLG